MRPAVFLKANSNEFVSVSPTIFGIVDYEGEPYLTGFTVDPIKLAGSLEQCIEEQEKAMKGKGSVQNRLNELKKCKMVLSGLKVK